VGATFPNASDGVSQRARQLIAAFDQHRPRVLSLDVFDTLLMRSVAEPTDAFAAVGRRVGELSGHPASDQGELYSVLRRAAESAARDASAGREVTLREIAERLARALPLDVAPALLMRAELEVERELVELDLDIAALVAHAAAQGVPYVLASDMYLAADDILALVEAATSRAGIDLPKPRKVFVSSEYGRGKSGGLFAALVSELATAPSAILHVGDHPISDVEAPRAVGIPSIHFSRESRWARTVLEAERALLSERPGDRGLATMRRKALMSTVVSDAESLDHRGYGAFIVGPVITAFAEWVVDDCVRSGARRVHCLMREGHLLAPLVRMAAAARGAELDVRELWVSRYAVKMASIRRASVRELTIYAQKRHGLSLPQMAQELRVDIEALRSATDVATDTPLDHATMRRVIAAIAGDTLLAEQVIDAAKIRRERLLRYFGDAGLLEHERATIVDLGWGGTIQSSLARVLVDEARPSQLHGLYLMTNQRLLDLPYERCSAQSFLVHLGEPQATHSVLARTPEILEGACMSPTGSLREIDEDGAPVHFEQRLSSSHLSAVAALQEGVHMFAKHWLRNSRRRVENSLHRDDAALRTELRALVVRSLQAPTFEEAWLLRDWEHDANDGSARCEPLLGDETLRARARHMTRDQIERLDWMTCYWPAGLAALVEPKPASPGGSGSPLLTARARLRASVDRSASGLMRLRSGVRRLLESLWRRP
jgi:predicted HAD superfamily hydrolase